MASGHVNRISRPNTWLHRPMLLREVLTCQPGAVHTWHLADFEEGTGSWFVTSQREARSRLAHRAVSDLIGSARDYPADLLRPFVCRCPGKGKKVWEAHTASFAQHLPSGKGAGDEPIVLRFFVHNAETCTRHCYENLAVQDFDDNFRSGMNESGHAQLGLLETAAFFRLRPNSEKFRNHCVTPALSTSNEPSSKAEKEPQSNLPCLMMGFTGSCAGGSVSKEALGGAISSCSRVPLERHR